MAREHAAVTPDAETGVARSRVLARRARSTWLGARRRAAWVLKPGDFPAPILAGSADSYPHVLYERRIPLQRRDGHGEAVFEAGRRMNVSLAAPRFNGLALLPGHTFSFWRAMGPIRASDGYRHGMELRGGCVVPAVGGGLCLLSNALFHAAAMLGWTILERHGHVMEAVPPVPGEVWGLDATVAYPYVDLRVALAADDTPARLGVAVRDDLLVVEVRGLAAATRTIALEEQAALVDVVAGQHIRRNRIIRRIVAADGSLLRRDVIAVNAKRLLYEAEAGRSCLTCGLTSCAGRVEVPLGERHAARL